MVRTKQKPKPKNVHVNLVFPKDVLDEVDALAGRLTAKEPGSIITRSVVVRRAVYAFLKTFDESAQADKTPKK